MKNYFEYNEGLDITNGAFRISASQISRFFDETSKWYREMLLGEVGFEGSTATELGTVVHAAAAMYFDTQSVDKQALLDYINNIKNTEVDKQEILKQYKPMIEVLVNNQLIKYKDTESESFIWVDTGPGVGVGGSIDRYDKHTGTIKDFKTIGSLDKARIPKKFPRNYWFQQMTYAWCKWKKGEPVNWMELIYVSRENVGRLNEKGKALKDYPSELHIVREPVTLENLQIIDDVINLITDSYKFWNDFPEYRYLIAQDYQLKELEKPKLFKD